MKLSSRFVLQSILIKMSKYKADVKYYKDVFVRIQMNTIEKI